MRRKFGKICDPHIPWAAKVKVLKSEVAKDTEISTDSLRYIYMRLQLILQ